MAHKALVRIAHCFIVNWRKSKMFFGDFLIFLDWKRFNNHWLKQNLSKNINEYTKVNFELCFKALCYALSSLLKKILWQLSHHRFCSSSEIKRNVFLTLFINSVRTVFQWWSVFISRPSLWELDTIQYTLPTTLLSNSRDYNFDSRMYACIWLCNFQTLHFVSVLIFQLLKIREPHGLARLLGRFRLVMCTKIANCCSNWYSYVCLIWPSCIAAGC